MMKTIPMAKALPYIGKLTMSATLVVLACGEIDMEFKNSNTTVYYRSIESAFAKNGEDDIEDEVEDDIEDEVEDDIEDEVEDDIEDEVEDDIEDEVEDDVENEVEDDIEDEVEDDIEDEVEDDIEDEVEDDIEDEVEDDIEDEIEGDIEDEVEDDIEDQLGLEIESEIEATTSIFIENQEIDFNNEIVDPDIQSKFERDLSKVENEIEDEFFNMKNLETDFDESNNEIVSGEWLVLALPSEVLALNNAGFNINQSQNLPSIGLKLVTLMTSEPVSIKDLRDQIKQFAPTAKLDRNHLFFEPSYEDDFKDEIGYQPTELIRLPHPERPVVIGVIDTSVEVDHPALINSEIYSQDFALYKGKRPNRHGTAVVSTLTGNDKEYKGLLSNAKIYSASVFFQNKDMRRISTTESITKAVDWMITNSVSVINMSFTGPYSNILDTLLSSLKKRGIYVVAAAGNFGPSAAPAYPAAYEAVIAVTAVNKNNRIYRLANRGDYIDFSAPGVDIRHAVNNGEYVSSSGTSMAAPFVAAVIATAIPIGEKVDQKTIEKLINRATDLGEKGFDPIYGHGLIEPME